VRIECATQEWPNAMRAAYFEQNGRGRTERSPRVRGAAGRRLDYAWLTPNLFSIDIIGHQSVNADWKRLAPTNAVK